MKCTKILHSMKASSTLRKEPLNAEIYEVGGGGRDRAMMTI